MIDLQHPRWHRLSSQVVDLSILVNQAVLQRRGQCTPATVYAVDYIVRVSETVLSYSATRTRAHYPMRLNGNPGFADIADSSRRVGVAV